MPRQSGMRLVEFLIPISLAALLATLAIPAFHKAAPARSGSASIPSLDPKATTSGSTSPLPNSHIPVSHPSDDELLDQALGKLRKGNLAYNTPEKMKTGQTAHVVARIGSDKVSIGALEAGILNDQETKTATAQTTVSTRMKMELKSADFDITPLSSEEQFVAGDTPTSWEWDISPKHSGKLRLHLAAIVELNGLSRDFTTVDRDVAVQVDPVDAAETFAKANGVWILTTVGAGLAGLWAWLRKKKKPKQPGWETP